MEWEVPGRGERRLAGGITYGELADSVQRGYATASTDTGHAGNGSDASFALGHPEKLIDLGYRSVHLMTIRSKAIIAAFYGNRPRLSYWNGCSTGGKQGLTEAQRYPDDYNGIVEGDPASFWTHLCSERCGPPWRPGGIRQATSRGANMPSFTRRRSTPAMLSMEYATASSMILRGVISIPR